jgi:hypothetical protein
MEGYIMKEELMKEIFLLEWDMFTNVSNVGGTASCQQDTKTFLIMRTSQIMSWTEPIMESYLEDLRAAKQEGRNLMSEKYAHMMKYTYPEEYSLLESRLPRISEEASELIDRITMVMIGWVKAMKLKYPCVISAGRPIDSFEDTPYETSLETYTRGEFSTYGIKTIKLCWEYFSKCFIEGTNIYEGVLLNMVKLYGYSSIEQVEELEKKAQKKLEYYGV